MNRSIVTFYHKFIDDLMQDELEKLCTSPEYNEMHNELSVLAPQYRDIINSLPNEDKIICELFIEKFIQFNKYKLEKLYMKSLCKK